jgi:hypothetical protein
LRFQPGLALPGSDFVAAFRVLKLPDDSVGHRPVGGLFSAGGVGAFNIFPCEVQNRYLEALGAAGGDSDSRAILDQATATGKRRETVCVKQMDRSQRLELRALSRRDMAVFMLRIPCFEQRRILTKCATQESDKSCERSACRQLFSDWRESLRLSLEEAILRQSEDLPGD